MWLASHHPLKMETFLPLLHVLSFSSKQVRKLSKYLMKYSLPKDAFPMRVKLPLFFFMEATFHFENLVFTSKRHFKEISQFRQIPVIKQNQSEFFDIDQKVENQRKEQVKAHYKNLHDPSMQLISSSHEEAAKHQVTLTKLYAQLNPVQDEDEDESSIREDEDHHDKNIE